MGPSRTRARLETAAAPPLTEENAALAPEKRDAQGSLGCCCYQHCQRSKACRKAGPDEQDHGQAPAPAHAPPGRGGSLRDDDAQRRPRIAADPQAFFAQADTNQDGSLDRDEWAQACESVLGHAAPDLAKALFDKMDFDKSGNVSMRHFVDIRRAVRLFVTQSGFQELVVESLSGLVYGHLSANASADAGTSLAEQTLRHARHPHGAAEEMRDEVGQGRDQNLVLVGVLAQERQPGSMSPTSNWNRTGREILKRQHIFTRNATVCRTFENLYSASPVATLGMRPQGVLPIRGHARSG